MSDDSTNHQPGAQNERAAKGNAKKQERDAEAHRIRNQVANERGAIGYSHGLLLQATLPYTDPGTTSYVGKNGDLEVTMTSAKGLPYGTYPRLALVWLTMQAQKNYFRYDENDPERLRLHFGHTMAEFMRQVGIQHSSHGVTGSATNMRNQLLRLFTTALTIEFHGESRRFYTDSGKMIPVTQAWNLRWNKDDLASAYENEEGYSYVDLSEAFFTMTVKNASPIDLDILRYIKRSPMAIDFYLWAVNRTYRLKKPTVVTIPQLMEQFGTKLDPTDPGARRGFTQKFKRAIEKVRDLWPDLNAELLPNGKGLMLKPSKSSVLSTAEWDKYKRALPD